MESKENILSYKLFLQQEYANYHLPYDKEMLFYMKSRGISEDEAKKMLTDAYLCETFNNICNEEYISWIKNEL